MAPPLEEVRKRYGFKTVSVATWRDPWATPLAGGRGPRDGFKVAPTEVSKPFIPTYKVRYPVPEPTDDEDSEDDMGKKKKQAKVQSPLEPPDEARTFSGPSEDDTEQEKQTPTDEPPNAVGETNEGGGIASEAKEANPDSDGRIVEPPGEDAASAAPTEVPAGGEDGSADSAPDQSTQEVIIAADLGDAVPPPPPPAPASDEVVSAEKAAADTATEDAALMAVSDSGDAAQQPTSNDDGHLPPVDDEHVEDKKVSFAPGTPEPKPTQRKKKGAKSSKSKKKRAAAPVSDLPPDVQALLDGADDDIPPPPPDPPATVDNDAPGDTQQPIPEDVPIESMPATDVPGTEEAIVVEDSSQELEPELHVDADDHNAADDAAPESKQEPSDNSGPTEAASAEALPANDPPAEQEAIAIETIAAPERKGSKKKKSSKKSSKKGSKTKPAEAQPPSGVGIDNSDDFSATPAGEDVLSGEVISSGSQVDDARAEEAVADRETAGEDDAIAAGAATPTGQENNSEQLGGAVAAETDLTADSDPVGGTLDGKSIHDTTQELSAEEAFERVASSSTLEDEGHEASIEEKVEDAAGPVTVETTDAGEDPFVIGSTDGLHDDGAEDGHTAEDRLTTDNPQDLACQDADGVSASPAEAPDESEVDAEPAVADESDDDAKDAAIAELPSAQKVTDDAAPNTEDAEALDKPSSDAEDAPAEVQNDDTELAPADIEEPTEEEVTAINGNDDTEHPAAEDSFTGNVESEPAAADADVGDTAAHGQDEPVADASEGKADVGNAASPEEQVDETATQDDPVAEAQVHAELAGESQQDLQAPGSGDKEVSEDTLAAEALEERPVVDASQQATPADGPTESADPPSPSPKDIETAKEPDAPEVEVLETNPDEQPLAPLSPVLSKTSSHGSNRSTHWDRPHHANKLKAVLEAPVALKRPHGHRTSSKDKVVHRGVSERKHRRHRSSTAEDKERREQRRAGKKKVEPARALEEERRKAADDERRRARHDARRAARKAVEEEMEKIIREEAKIAAEKDAERRRRRRREREEREIGRREQELKDELREKASKAPEVEKRDGDRSSITSRNRRTSNLSTSSRPSLAKVFTGESVHRTGFLVSVGAPIEDRPISRHSKETLRHSQEAPRSPRMERSKTSPASVAAPPPPESAAGSHRSRRAGDEERSSSHRSSRHAGSASGDGRRRRPTLEEKEKPKGFLASLFKRS